MKRWALWGGGLVAVAAIIISSWLLLTEGGLRFAFSRLVAALPVAVTADSLTGRIAGRISVETLRVSDASFQLKIDHTDLELSLLSLLKGDVHLRALDVRDVWIETGAGQVGEQSEPPDSARLPAPELPFNLRIDALTAADISVLRPAESPMQVRGVSVSGLVYAEQQWRVSSLDVDTELLTGAGGFTYRTAGKHELTFHFKGKTQVYDNEINISINLEGDEDRLELLQSFDGALSGRVTGGLNNVFTAPEWTVTADLEFAELSRWFPDLPPGRFRTALEAQGMGSNVLGKGSLAPEGQSRLFFDAELAVAADALNIKRLELREEGGPTSLTFAGELGIALPFPRVRGQLQWTALGWPVLRKQGEFPLINSPTGRIDIDGAEGRYQLQGQAALSDGPTTGTFTTAGMLDLSGPEARFDLSGRWDTLAIQVAEQSYVARSGQYSLKGLASAYQFGGGFELLREGWPAVRIAVSGHGDEARLSFDSIDAESSAGGMEASGSVALADDRPFELEILGSGINPGAFVNGWPGSLDLAAGLTGVLDADGTSLQLDIRKLRGVLQEQPLSGRGQMGYAQDELRFTGLTARWGEAALSAEGSLGARMDFSWRLSIPDLAVLIVDGTGRVESSGKLAGSRLRPVVEAKLEGEGLSFGAYAAQQLRLDANVDFADQASSTLSASASGVELSGTRIDKLMVEGEGQAGDHHASLRIETGQGVLSSELSGQLDKKHWSGTIASTRIDLKSGEWVQDTPAAFSISETDWSAGEICVRLAPASVCASAAGATGKTPSLELEWQSLPLSELGLLLPEGLEYAGAISGRARIDGLTQGAAGAASFDVSAGRVWQMVDGEPLVLLDFSSVKGEAQLADGRLSMGAALLEPGTPELSMQLSLPFENWGLVNGEVNGQLDGTLVNLGFLSVLFPDLADIRGRVETQIRLSGTTEAARWDGYAELLDGQGILPGLGITVSDLVARIEAAADALRVTASMRSGQGELSLEGELALSGTEMRGRFQLTGQDFLAADLPEARIVMSPRLVLELAGQNLQLQGDVAVPEAHIAPRDLSEAIQRSPDEQVMREDGALVSTDEWLLGGRVRIEFGDKVTFDGFDLKARITGAVTAVDQPGRVTTATGEVQIVDGVYNAYGRDLEVRKGRLLFSGGPLANPGLDILALRQIEGGPEVGVIARATLDEPELTLYSSPSMQPAQILSYLLVGQPLADIGGVDKQLVSDTAATLATAGGGLLAQQLGRRLGLGDVSVASGSTGETASLVIGKYLSPRLYASYGIGLFEPINTLRLRYALSSKWNLRAESGLNQSLDLEYTLDR